MPKVWTFFYGSFINLDVLRILGVVPEKHEAARLSGFDIKIQPLANVIRSEKDCVYGIVALVSHDELRKLYDYAKNELGTVYLPVPVLVEHYGHDCHPLWLLSLKPDPKRLMLPEIL